MCLRNSKQRERGVERGEGKGREETGRSCRARLRALVRTWTFTLREVGTLEGCGQRAGPELDAHGHPLVAASGKTDCRVGVMGPGRRLLWQEGHEGAGPCLETWREGEVGRPRTGSQVRWTHKGVRGRKDEPFRAHARFSIDWYVPPWPTCNINFSLF